jgi:hypothetical protein
MVMNKDGFDVLATLKGPIDCVVRHSETQKLDFVGIPFIETKLTDRYGYQVVIGAYGSEGKWPINIQTEYRIDRPRVEIAIPSASALDFLRELHRNLPDAIKPIREWERRRGLR